MKVYTVTKRVAKIDNNGKHSSWEALDGIYTTAEKAKKWGTWAMRIHSDKLNFEETPLENLWEGKGDLWLGSVNFTNEDGDFEKREYTIVESTVL